MTVPSKISSMESSKKKLLPSHQVPHGGNGSTDKNLEPEKPHLQKLQRV